MMLYPTIHTRRDRAYKRPLPLLALLTIGVGCSGGGVATDSDGSPLDASLDQATVDEPGDATRDIIAADRQAFDAPPTPTEAGLRDAPMRDSSDGVAVLAESNIDLVPDMVYCVAPTWLFPDGVREAVYDGIETIPGDTQIVENGNNPTDCRIGIPIVARAAGSTFVTVTVTRLGRTLSVPLQIRVRDCAFSWRSAAPTYYLGVGGVASVSPRWDLTGTQCSYRGFFPPRLFTYDFASNDVMEISFASTVDPNARLGIRARGVGFDALQATFRARNGDVQGVLARFDVQSMGTLNNIARIDVIAPQPLVDAPLPVTLSPTAECIDVRAIGNFGLPEPRSTFTQYEGEIAGAVSWAVSGEALMQSSSGRFCSVARGEGIVTASYSGLQASLAVLVENPGAQVALRASVASNWRYRSDIGRFCGRIDASYSADGIERAVSASPLLRVQSSPSSPSSTLHSASLRVEANMPYLCIESTRAAVETVGAQTLPPLLFVYGRASTELRNVDAVFSL